RTPSTTISTFTTTKITTQDNQPSSVSKKEATTSTISTTPTISSKKIADDSSRIILISTTVGGGVFLSIVLIALLVKCQRQKRASKLSSPVDIPLEAVGTPQEPLVIDEEPGYETVPRVTVRDYYEDVTTNANKSKDISFEGKTLHYEEVDIPSNAVRNTSGYTEYKERPFIVNLKGTRDDGGYRALLKENGRHIIPDEPQYETPSVGYEEPKISPENPGYTELDKNRLQGRNAMDDDTYQKLLKRDSSYVMPAHENIRESYEDIKMGRNVPDYTDLDLSKREAEDYPAYQELVKT
ncbi:Hypothetical predicted protein, partial [Paramuricea clavata]